jgi:desulfoferrodoxin (superoxide reductase-like protein)
MAVEVSNLIVLKHYLFCNIFGIWKYE